MAKKVYYTMNEVPVGTDMVYKYDGRRCKLLEIHNFPTMFKVEFEDGTTGLCLTHEVDIIGWPPNE
tara:strand:- start:148 stop:345 length:198 start_codon:yes stop_codon:yes gene_type:complete